jgi:hypothetical protein
MMDTLPHLDAAIAAYPAHYRALGRGYDQEEWVLGVHALALQLSAHLRTDRVQLLPLSPPLGAWLFYARSGFAYAGGPPCFTDADRTGANREDADASLRVVADTYFAIKTGCHDGGIGSVVH